MNLSGLRNKVVIVTGASRGIGRATAEQFAREGARLILNYRQDDAAMEECRRACEERGAVVEVIRADVGDATSAKRICALACERFGCIDVLVNNAGAVVETLLATLSDDDLSAMISTNILGTVRMSREVLPTLLRQRSGCIINLSSALASKPSRGSSVYAGTKGFVESFTRSLAVEVGRKDVRVNAIAPGIIATDMTAQIRSLAEESLLACIPQKRIGRPEEVASIAAFLASDEAQYINGAVIPVDGAFMGGG